jgi:hypothetical protein
MPGRNVLLRYAIVPIGPAALVADHLLMGPVRITAPQRRLHPMGGGGTWAPPAWAWRVALVAAIMTVTLAVVGVWSVAGADELSATSMTAIRAECGERVASGLSPDKSTCLSWATESLLDRESTRAPAPAMVVLVIAIALLTGLVADALAGTPWGDRNPRRPGPFGSRSVILPRPDVAPQRDR